MVKPLRTARGTESSPTEVFVRVMTDSKTSVKQNV